MKYAIFFMIFGMLEATASESNSHTTMITTDMEVASVQQTTPITGTVVDEEGSPLLGVSVAIKGSSQGTVTDLQGKYNIAVPSTGSVLIFSYIGYLSQEVLVGNQRTINVALKENVHAIDEVIVVAYGTTKKSSFTGSASVVGGEKLERISGTGFAEALQGLSAGVNVVNSQGNPGADARIEIRGISSYSGSSNPLYIVDGMPYDGKLNQINPNDIESMTVLKDAAATSLYGSRAANGVVVITTKKGQTGKPRINVRSSWGTSDNAVKNPPKADPYQQLENFWYAAYYDEVYRKGRTPQEAGDIASERALTSQLKGTTDSNGNFIYVTPFKYINENYVLHDGNGNPYMNPKLEYAWEEKDWDAYAAVFSRKLRQDYNVDVSTQSESGKTSYFFSGGYMDDQGYGNRQYYKRFSFRTNINTEIKDWWKAGLSLSYSRHRQNMSGGASRALNFSTTLSSPWLRNRDNTDWVYSEKTGNRMLSYGTYINNFFGIHVLNNSGDYWDNPDDLSFDNNEGNTITAQLFNEFKLPGNLTFKTALNLNDNWQRNMSYSSAVNSSDPLPPYGITVSSGGGYASRYNYGRFAVTLNNVLSGSWTINSDHNISALAGQEFYTWNSSSEQGTGDGIMEIGKYELSNTTRNYRVYGRRDSYALLSFLGKLDYNFKNKYYLSGSIREDSSSRFHPDNRSGMFWSVGASWRISEEEFLQGKEWLNNLALRGSYGATGNDRLIPRQSNLRPGDEILYAYQGTYLNNNLYQTPGLKPYTAPTPNLQWENNIQWNVGLDFTVFNRFNGTLEYYSRTSKGLLFYRDLPPSAQVGEANGYNMNIGDMRNSGLEFTLNANVFARKKFRWDIDFNISTLKNEMIKLPDGPFPYSGTGCFYKMEEGKSLYEFIAPQFDGINPENGLNGWLIRDGKGGWKRTEVQTEVTTDDMVYVGSAIPKGFGSITNNFIYKGFDLSFMFYFSFGSRIYDYEYREKIMIRPGMGVAPDLVENRWKKPGDTGVDIARWSLDDYAATFRYSNNYVLKNDFARLRNLTLGYTLPATVSKKAGIEKLRLYLTGNNLMTFGSAAKRYTDPETGVQGNNYNGNNDLDNGIQGSRRIYMLGLQLTF